VSLGDRIRSFFSRRSNPALAELEAFASEHKGVEGYIEPRTATSPTTLLLVDRYGEHLRGPVRDPEDGFAFCRRLGVPVYDAQVVGYPKRMRDYERNRRATAEDSLDRTIEDLERLLDEPEDPPPPEN
jgi:hypothetical protein